MITETKQAQLDELERLLMDIMGNVAWLSLRIRRLIEVENFAHPEVAEVEKLLLGAGRAACCVDVRLFDDASGCASRSLH